MKAYAITISGLPDDPIMVYLSLKEICNYYELNYYAAIRGKRRFKKLEIVDVKIIGRKKRGRLGSRSLT